MISFRLHCALASCLVGLGGVLISISASPVRALERLRMTFPLLESEVTLELGEAETAQQLLMANPDLAELDRIGEGAVTKVFKQVLTTPLPEESARFVRESAGDPLFEQALLAVSELMKVRGKAAPIGGADLRAALKGAYRDGQPHVLGVLRRLPGTTASIDLQALLFYANRLMRQQRAAQTLIQAGQPAAAPARQPALKRQAAASWISSRRSLVVSHRPKRLEVVLVQPKAQGNGRLVLISHGLWDEPASFLGWAQWLAARGYTVLMPVHQGSDLAQQQAMLVGEQPPPQANELRLRPLDITALIDAVAEGRLLAGADLNTDAVAMVGHSWGATTTLQVAGLSTTETALAKRCQDPLDPDRNLSWVLQCSWLTSAAEGSLGDPRVKAVVAVSPPLRLLFASARGTKLSAKVLLVSGSRDWLVPPGPEAVDPLRFGDPMANGHRLVLVSGGDHFNLRAPLDQGHAPVLAPLIESWVNQELNTAASIRFDAGGWGSDRLPLVDVTPQL